MRIVHVAALAACACLVPLRSGAQTGKGLSQADVASINKVSETQAKAILAKDWTTFADVYVADAVLHPPNEPAVKGRAAIKAFAERFPSVTDFKLTNVTVDGCNDLAYVVGTYTMTIAPAGTTAPIKDSGKYVEVRRKQRDGRWLIAVDTFNSDLPVTPAPR
jgi:uncharacterized protein (TIGR02246 family)